MEVLFMTKTYRVKAHSHDFKIWMDFVITVAAVKDCDEQEDLIFEQLEKDPTYLSLGYVNYVHYDEEV